MAKQENIAAMQALGKAINEGDFEAMRRGFAANVKDHDPAANQGEGAEGFVRFFKVFRTAFPDLTIAPERLVADDENIAMAYTITGTQKGVFEGIAPTGKKIHARGVLIARFENGKMVERWGSSDELGILKQLGAKVNA